MTDKAKFYIMEGDLVRMLPGRVMPDLLGARGWELDYDLEGFYTRASEIDEAEARKRAGGIDLYGPTTDRGDNADTDRQRYTYDDDDFAEG